MKEEKNSENNFVEPKCKVLPAERPVSNFMKIGRTAGPILSNRKMPNRRHTSYFCPHCEHRFGRVFASLLSKQFFLEGLATLSRTRLSNNRSVMPLDVLGRSLSRILD